MKRILLTITVTYATSAGAIWGAVEAYTYFEGEQLKHQLGGYWPLLFIVLPGGLAAAAGWRAASKARQEAADVQVSSSRIADGRITSEAESSHEQCTAEAELMLAFHSWWGSVKDYETSGAEMVDSASDAGLMPHSPDMGVQLDNFEVVKMKTWPFLSEETKCIAQRTEDAFLRFMARVYAGVYNHEVYGHLVPKEVMRNLRIQEMILRQTPTHTFSDCEQTYRDLRAHFEDHWGESVSRSM